MIVGDLNAFHIGKPFELAMAYGTVTGRLERIQHSSAISIVDATPRCHLWLEVGYHEVFSAIVTPATEITALA